MKHFNILSDHHTLSGVLHEAQEGKKSIILIIHGYFSSNKTGYNRLYYDLANSLSNQDFITIRCDLRGMGESDGDLYDINFENHVADVINLVKYISKKFDKKITLIGHSIGCLISLHSYYRIPEVIDKIILLSPLFFNEEVLLRFFDKKNLLELKETGRTCRKGIIVDYSFFSEQMSLDRVADKIKECGIPIKIIFGDADRFFKKNEILALLEATGNRSYIIANCDHNFSSRSCREELIYEIFSFLNL